MFRQALTQPRGLPNLGTYPGAFMSTTQRPQATVSIRLTDRANEQVNDYLPMSKRDIIKFEGPAQAASPDAANAAAMTTQYDGCLFMRFSLLIFLLFLICSKI